MDKRRKKGVSNVPLSNRFITRLVIVFIALAQAIRHIRHIRHIRRCAVLEERPLCAMYVVVDREARGSSVVN